MKSDEGFSNMLDKTILIQYQHENVIPYQSENTLNTEIKQNLNPRNESFGGFFYISYLVNNGEWSLIFLSLCKYLISITFIFSLAKKWSNLLLITLSFLLNFQL